MNKLYQFLIVVFMMILISISLLTTSIGAGDPDYPATAKFFAGKLNSNIRSSHSYLYGFVHSPLISLTNSFFALKLMNLIYLVILILSAYYISNCNKKVLLLLLFSPVVWYMSPWVNPIPIASIFFLWGYYFMKKYNETGSIFNLSLSGIFLGLSYCFWDAVIFFILILCLIFLFDKKLMHALFFVLFLCTGLLPKLILDQILFGSFAVGVLRYIFAQFTAVVWKGIYGTMWFSITNIYAVLATALLIPISLYYIRLRQIKSKQIIFIIASLLLILLNSHISYLLLIAPIIILESVKNLDKDKFIACIIISLVITIVVVCPYVIQIKHDTNGDDLRDLALHFHKGTLIINHDKTELYKDLDILINEYPDEVFIVGNSPDDYLDTFLDYWGDGITFVSIQDYQLWQNQESVLFTKTYAPKSNIQNRREIWLSGGISKNSGDNTDYASIKYAICKENTLDIEGFKFVKKYKTFTLFEK